MLKHFSLCLCLLTLAACGSQPDSGAPDAATPGPAATTGSNAAMQTSPASAATSTRPQSAAMPQTPAAASVGAASSTQTPAPADSAPQAGDTATQTTSANTQQDNAHQNATADESTPSPDDSQWVQGKNYFVINPRQPVVQPGDKINVTEVFSYGCPACDHAHIWIDKIKRSLPDNAVMTYLPAAFRPDENWVVYQRAYFAAKALGVADKSYDAMFDAVFKSGEIGSYNQDTGQLLPKSEWPGIHKIATFYKKHYGIDPDKFVAVANSFSTNVKMKQADDLVKAYGVQGTPTIVVDGRYRFDFSSAGSYPKGIELAQYLVSKAQADHAASGQ